MKAEYICRILGKFQTKETIRLANLSGSCAWRKTKKEDPDKVYHFPFGFDFIQTRQREMFKTAKELRDRGLLRIVYKRGENWFVKSFTEPKNPEQYMESIVNE